MVQGFVYDLVEVAMDEFLSSESSQQANNISAELSKLPPLNLTLRKTPSFLNLLKTKLSNPEGSTSRQAPEKMKASNFPATFLRIGSWQEVSRHESDLVAKCYYSKRKLVWEVLRNGLKSKIEIQWSDISAIRANLREEHPGILEIELDQAPTFYRESNPQPRKHTIWHMTSDFTDGHASLHRRHYVKFPPGVLDRQYEKLLQCDQRLLELSRKGFPSHDSPYFDWAPYEYNLNYSFDPQGHEIKPQIHFGAADHPGESQHLDPVHQLCHTHQGSYHPGFIFEDSNSLSVSGTQGFQGDNTITGFSTSSNDQLSGFGFGDSTTVWAHGTDNIPNNQAFYGTMTPIDTHGSVDGAPNIYQQNLYDDCLHNSYVNMESYADHESSLISRPFQDTSYGNSDFTTGTINEPQTCSQFSNSSLPSQAPDKDPAMHQYGNFDYMYPPFSHGL